MNKIKKFYWTVILFIMANFKNVYAFSVTDLNGSQVTDGTTIEYGNKLVTLLTTVGSVFSVVVLIIIGIKYLIGTTEEKAEYKKTLMPYVIGCFLVFTASTIAGVFYTIAPK